MTHQTELLIIGAGPFGIGLAAFAKLHSIEHQIIGRPMDFWKANMPPGMLLRSGVDWHLDTEEIHTIEAYLKSLGKSSNPIEPLSRQFYLDYVEWFVKSKAIEIRNDLVDALHYDREQKSFTAELQSGAKAAARRVVLAIGFRNFKFVPSELSEIIPNQKSDHTCDLVDLKTLSGRKCLIIGGRQSAYEWAALLRESDAKEVHVCHRHEIPQFTESDWSWVTELIDKMQANPGWYHALTAVEQEQIGQRFWEEGRLKLEPWLWPRVNHDNVHIWPSDRVISCEQLRSGELNIELASGSKIVVDNVIYATGYQVDLRNVPMLTKGNLLSMLDIRNGLPALNEQMESNVPDLYFTSMPATQDFGPFFAFTVSVVASSRIVGTAIIEKLECNSPRQFSTE